ncbi:MAG: hypothetical protein WAN35_05040 [Terracidiphilus sp.]
MSTSSIEVKVLRCMDAPPAREAEHANASQPLAFPEPVTVPDTEVEALLDDPTPDCVCERCAARSKCSLAAGVKLRILINNPVSMD